ncbi:Hypothetical predicted protein [Drosophila guanche]|uniref:Uncharacterized protein n=1 Tax=Drosophila guanche TaxID=7266 RepID=A0A3B0JQ84_DROGU|nr:Hypothetical predicted protein [Drosophila guanche]
MQHSRSVCLSTDSQSNVRPDQSRHSTSRTLGYKQRHSSFDVPSPLSLKLHWLWPWLLQLQLSEAGGSLNQIRTLDSDTDYDSESDSKSAADWGGRQPCPTTGAAGVAYLISGGAS